MTYSRSRTRSVRDDVRITGAVATDAYLRRRRAERFAMGQVDEDCRFAKASITHECKRSTGEDIRAGQQCWIETAAQLREQAAVLATTGDSLRPGGHGAAGEPQTGPRPPVETPARPETTQLPQYRLIEPDQVCCQCCGLALTDPTEIRARLCTDCAFVGLT